jgi:hypothetical protein
VNTNFESNDRQIDRMAGCAAIGLFIGKWTIRLLVLWFVGFILMILLGYVFEGYNHGSRKNIDRLRTKATMKDLRTGLTLFKVEYQQHPVPASKDVFLRSEGRMILPLLGQNKEANPRAIRFVDLPFARNGRHGGLTGIPRDSSDIPADTTLTDSWGEMFYLLIDDSEDEHHRLPNPEHRTEVAQKKNVPEFLNTSMLIFSSGPDRDPQTWADNICSWR